MAVKTVVNLIDKWELLLMYRDYVDRCIDKFAIEGAVVLLSFEEWVKDKYASHMETLTDVIHVEVSHDVYVDPEKSSETETTTSEFHIRIPKGIVSDKGVIINAMELSRLSQKLVAKKELLVATVIFNNDKHKNYEAYSWNWE